ncbi:MAG: hypothetical protein AAB558_03950 [Patescibacteria group bacterium]
MIAEVIPRLRGIRKLEILDYLVPTQGQIEPGMTVEIPFRSQTILGVVVKLKTSSESKRLKSILRVVNEEASLSPLQIELVYHLSKRTGAPLSTCLLTVVQAGGVGQNKKESQVVTGPLAEAGKTTIARQRLPMLKKTVARIQSKKEPVVLRYDQTQELAAIASLLSTQAKQSLILVPHEEALLWWKEHLHHLHPVIYSSRNKITEQRDIFQAVRSGQAKVIIGTRGAIFLPPDHWEAILVVDEEHTSYHQDQNPRFQTVELAAWLAQGLHIPCVLSSQSPRVASAYQFAYIDISQPPSAMVNLINLQDWWTSGQSGLLTDSLLAWVKEHLPAVLVYNRKGEFRWLRCLDCQQVSPLGTAECPHCHSLRLKPSGMGNQKVEQLLKQLLPDLTINRWDADSTTPLPSGDVLLTTSFGLPRIPWKEYRGIGVISVDHQLAIPDFRTNERTLSFLTSLIRTNLPVAMQTSSPSHPVITTAISQDYASFYEMELALRKKLHYPPFGIVVAYINTNTRAAVVRKFPAESSLPLPPEGSVLDILE